MLHPYQCFALGRTGDSNVKDVFLAANRGHVYAFNVQSGTLLSTWPEHAEDNSEEIPSSPEIITVSNDGDLPVRKRRKVSKSQKANGASARCSTITKLVSSSDGCFAVAVSGEDKLVHVLKIAENGVLMHLSQRRMTKRPCALTIVSSTGDPDYILCGDKFGDVYALPLLYEHGKDIVEDQPKDNGHLAPVKAFKPSATTLTVHTAKNRKALEAQLRDEKQRPKQKEKIEFEHELLLGHVSMLTDLAAVTLENERPIQINGTSTTGRRSYILTADRDEHIRVSRGRPQSHIIENFCFGHTQFVNKLCLVKPTVLVSGGGDDYLFVWNWRQGHLFGKIDLRQAIEKYWNTQPFNARRTKASVTRAKSDVADLLLDSTSTVENQEDDNLLRANLAEQIEEEPIAVIGLWSVLQDNPTEASFDVICACEGIPALFRYRCEDYTRLGDHSEETYKADILPLEGNPLDVAIIASRLLVAVDCVHQAGKPIMLRDQSTENESVVKVQEFSLDLSGDEASREVPPSDPGSDLAQNLNRIAVSNVDTDGQDLTRLQQLFYGAEHLRKHGMEDDISYIS